MSKISLVRKVTMIATMFALALAAFSATNVFAAGSTTTATSTQAAATNLEKSWKAEISTVKVESDVLNRYDRMLDNVVFRNKVAVRLDERGKSDSQRGLQIFSLFLSKAEAIISAHAGFDANGKITDQAMAAKSVQDLSIFLSELRESRIAGRGIS